MIRKCLLGHGVLVHSIIHVWYGKILYDTWVLFYESPVADMQCSSQVFTPALAVSK